MNNTNTDWPWRHSYNNDNIDSKFIKAKLIVIKISDQTNMVMWNSME